MENSKIIKSVLREAGISPALEGYEAMATMVELIMCKKGNPRRQISKYYDDIGKIVGANASNVARRIRSAIQSACSRYGIEQVRKTLRLPISEESITAGEFIFAVYEISQERIDESAD